MIELIIQMIISNIFPVDLDIAKSLQGINNTISNSDQGKGPYANLPNLPKTT